MTETTETTGTEMKKLTKKQLGFNPRCPECGKGKLSIECDGGGNYRAICKAKGCGKEWSGFFSDGDEEKKNEWLQDFNGNTRCKKDAIEMTETLQLWFEVATLAYDQGLYPFRQVFFENRKRYLEAFHNLPEEEQEKIKNWDKLSESEKKKEKKPKVDFERVKIDKKNIEGTGLDLNSYVFEKLAEYHPELVAPSSHEETDKKKNRKNPELIVPNTLVSVVVEKVVCNDWSNFEKSLNKYFKNPQKYNGLPRPPQYKHDRENNIFNSYATIQFFQGSGHYSGINYEKRTITVGGSLVLRVPDIMNFNWFVRRKSSVKLIHCGDKVAIVYSYEKEIPKTNPCNPNNVLSIDLGVKRLCTLVTNGTKIDQSMFIDGGTVLSILQNRNRLIAEFKSVLDHQYKGERKTSERIRNLYRKCGNKINTELDYVSIRIVKWALDNDIGKIVVGYNKDWKNESNMGKKNNQKFAQMPHKKLIEKLKYKCEDAGILLEEIEESYTSKTDHAAKEELLMWKKGRDARKDHKFLGRRVERGLFESSVIDPRTGKRKLINADVNGAIGIGRKAGVWSDEDLEHLKDRNDISFPKKLEYKPRQGSYPHHWRNERLKKREESGELTKRDNISIEKCGRNRNIWREYE